MTQKTKKWLLIGALILAGCRYFFGTWNPIAVIKSFTGDGETSGSGSEPMN